MSQTYILFPQKRYQIHMKNIHFIGIGGISMSGIAQILKARGYRVTGSDIKKTDITEHLNELDIPVTIGQRAGNITDDMDTVVYTAAVKEDNEELTAARAMAGRTGARVIERAVLLGDLFGEYGVPIAVAGTHGKTSTSSMISYVYMQAGKDPTVAIGGILQNLGENFRVGNSSYMVIEACEYMDSFLHFHPKYAVITNIEAEHLDYFGDLEHIKASFRQYVDGMRPSGTLIVGIELKELFADYTGRLWTVSLKNEAADLHAANITAHDETLGSSFDVVFKGENLGRIDLYVPGHHLIYDALCAIGASLADGISFENIRAGISNYRSTKKRFEIKGRVGGVTVVDDYAHHPSEIRATLEAAAEVPHRELYVVFQPHTYSRTKSFLPQFAEALSAADHILLAPIYAAREKDPGTVSSQDIADLLVGMGKDSLAFPSFDEIENYLLEKLSPNDLLITMGAGDVVKIGETLLGQ